MTGVQVGEMRVRGLAGGHVVDGRVVRSHYNGMKIELLY
jgi:hypothetical protein